MGNQCELEVEKIARRNSQFIKRAYLSEILPLLPAFDDPRRWPVEGLEHLDHALARKRGAILATAHLGYPRLIAPILETHGYEVRQVVAGGARREKREREEKEPCECEHPQAMGSRTQS